MLGACFELSHPIESAGGRHQQCGLSAPFVWIHIFDGLEEGGFSIDENLLYASERCYVSIDKLVSETNNGRP